MKMRLLIFILYVILASGCASFKSKSEIGYYSYIEPSQETVRKVDAILEKALAFQKTSEITVLTEGRLLTEDEIKYALELGVKHPEKIRIQYQWVFPKPQDKELLLEFKRLGFGSWFEGGRTNGHGIFIKSYFPNKSSIIRHELVHVKQMETLGLKSFTHRYLVEAMTYDYFDMPLEVEAFNRTEGKNY